MSPEVELLTLISLMHTTLAAYHSVARKGILLDFVFWILPMLACIILPDRSVQTHLLFLGVLLANGFKQFSVERKKPTQRRLHPELCLMRGHIMLMVTISIFACDFSFFPSRFLKTKQYGVSLMDVGIGSFLYHNGMVSVRLSRRKLLRNAATNLLLGTIRLCTIRYFSYAVDITEYGRDMNFYFVLAATYMLFAAVNSKYNFYTALLLTTAHQVLLECGLGDYVFNKRRDSILDLNKEGVVGIAPSLAIFLLSNRVGHIVFASEDNLTKAARIFFCGILFLYGYSFTSERAAVSRRLGNVSYVLWIMLVHTVQLFLCYVSCAVGIRASFVHSFCSENMLFVFLWSNILVLVANLCCSLGKLDFYTSAVCNIAYTVLVFVVPVYAVRLRFAFRARETMNEQQIEQLLKNNVNSMNDYTEEEIKSIARRYYKNNKGVICKHLGLYTRKCELEDGILSFFCERYRKQSHIERKLVECRFKFGKGSVLVPMEFVALMEVMLKKNCKDIGLFRKPSCVADSQESLNVLIRSVERGDSLETILRKLNRYNPTILSGNFKYALSNFPCTIFPPKFLNSVLKITTVEDEEEKYILSKYILLKMPRVNRSILEAITKFFEIVHDITTNGGVNYVGNLDLRGYGTVIMPDLFLSSEKNLSFRDLTDLAEYAGYLIVNFKKLIDVAEIQS
ncbi:UNVERIFIED_CONTAM: hypothetical protein PYX00_011746 [Menopon gallinae]|uniref:Rho-GAP domain-containing protein n=1 Tax=Menopon gallinae TaxID=328185 RepID=A0AAW2H8L0_9NEOP